MKKIITTTIGAAILTNSILFPQALSANEQVNKKYNFSIASEEHNSSTNLIADSEITLSIKKQYFMDDRINGFNIRVVTEDGKVKLTGTVPSQETKDLLVSIAKRTTGVKRVESNIKVTDKSLIREATRDSIITNKIKITLLDDSEIYDSNISVKTTNGIVTLSGKVPSEKMRARAIHLAYDINNVKDVIAEIEVDPSLISSSLVNLPSDSAITMIIKLRYLEDEVLSTLTIQVKTINAEVILSGTVKTNEAKDRAISIAKLTNGVKKVTSQLVVQNK